MTTELSFKDPAEGGLQDIRRLGRWMPAAFIAVFAVSYVTLTQQGSDAPFLTALIQVALPGKRLR